MKEQRDHTMQRILIVGLLAATTGFALDGVPFPGPAISPTRVKMSDEECVIGNNTLTAMFQRHGSTLRLAALRSPLNGLGLAWSDPNLFTIYLTFSEMRMAAGYSSGLAELYITPALMTSEAWDGLAECIRWARAKQAVMVDSHWVGGDPHKNEIYGFAAWHPQLGGVLTLRNPDDKPQTCQMKLAAAFELPVAAETQYELRSPWKADAHRAPVKADANVPVQFTLQPFEVITLETQP